MITQSSEYDVKARQFPKGAGYNEDPATGVAACALGAFIHAKNKKRAGMNTWSDRDMQWEDQVLLKPLHIFLKEV